MAFDRNSALDYVERLPWDSLFGKGDPERSKVPGLLDEVTDSHPDLKHRRNDTPLRITGKSLWQCVRLLGQSEPDRGKLARHVAAFAESGGRAELAAIEPRVRAAANERELHQWSLPFDGPDTVDDRLFEILAVRFERVEDKFDWLLTTQQGSPMSLVVGARGIAHDLGQPAPATVKRAQYMGAPALQSILRVLRAYDAELLGKYEETLRYPMSLTKSEKEELKSEFAEPMRAAKERLKAAAAAAAKEARARAHAQRKEVRGAKPQAPATQRPLEAMPRYDGEPASFLLYGTCFTGWIKLASFEALVEVVQQARDALKLPLVCLAGSEDRANKKEKDYLFGGHVAIAVGLELARTRPKAEQCTIEPEAIEAAKKTLKKVLPADFWERVASAAKELRGGSKPSAIIVASGRKAETALVIGKDGKGETLAYTASNGDGVASVPALGDRSPDVELFLLPKIP